MRFVLTLLLVFMLSISLADALGLGVSPPEISAKNLVRGSHFEDTVYISRSDTAIDVAATASIEGNAAEWVTIVDGKSFRFPTGEQQIPLKIAIDVPEDAANGEYLATVRIRSETASSDKPGIGSSIIIGLVIKVNIAVTGEQIIDYEITSVTIPQTEIGIPLAVLLMLDNKGNVKISPSKVEISIFDKKKENMLFSKVIDNMAQVPPFSKGKILLELEHQLGEGQYWAVIKIYRNDEVINEQPILFDVLKDGTLERNAELTGIITDAKYGKGEIVKITGLFANTGTNPVTAKLIAEIYKEGRLIKVAESEESRAVPGETTALYSYYTAEESGDFKISAYALYYGKKTEIKEAYFTVSSSTLITIAFALLAAVILATIILAWRKVNEA